MADDTANLDFRDSDVVEQRFRDFTEGVRDCRHPSHCRLIWNGQVGQIVFTRKFQREDDEPLDRIRRRAWQWLASLRPAEWQTMEIDILVQEYVPRTATVKVRSDLWNVFRLATTRLQELAGDLAAKVHHN